MGTIFQKNDFSLCNNFNNGAMRFHHVGAKRQFFQAVNGQKFSFAIELKFFSFIMLYCILVTFISKQKEKRRKLFY